MRTTPHRHLRLVDDRAARPQVPILTTTVTPLDRAELASTASGVRWVLLDDTEQPVDVARTEADVVSYVAMMLALGVGFAVEPIRDRCRICGAHPTDQHAPGVCPEGI